MEGPRSHLFLVILDPVRAESPRDRRMKDIGGMIDPCVLRSLISNKNKTAIV